MVTEDDIKNADYEARESKFRAEEIRDQAVAEHRETADKENEKADELESTEDTY